MTKSPLTEVREALKGGSKTPTSIARDVIANANANASQNTYLHFDGDALLRQARGIEETYAGVADKPPLYGVPISLKDLFDLEGTVTTAGSKYYADRNARAREDSAMALRLKSVGALITGKTHLHQLAYGITGQNPDFGDCVQPRDAALLTGGSSSGAVASVQEGSALAAIGTDTGGSIRVPAALCGLAGYRASRSLAYAAGPWAASPKGLWAGAVELARSFDTPGIFTRCPKDLTPIAHALFGLEPGVAPLAPRIGFIDEAFLHDADADVMTAFRAFREVMRPVSTFEAPFFADAREICAGIQAHEAAAVHEGAEPFGEHFEASIAQRLAWGAGIPADELATLRARHGRFCAQVAELFAQYDFLVVPASPLSKLFANEDQNETRVRILRYTTPFSLAGTPVVTLPGELIAAPFGTGVQVVAPAGEDAALLAFAGAFD